MSGSVIYKPKGKAGEYADGAVNIYAGCGGKCKYCYVPGMLRMDRKKFHASVSVREGILEKLRKEAPKHEGKEVFLCFTCDPYPAGDISMTTREAIQILHGAGVAVNILTKGGLRAERDFDLLSARPELSRIGATLTFLEKRKVREWEPNAQNTAERIDMLANAHARGIPTWASLEPVIEPEQTLELIRLTHPFVDHYKIGRWNHDPRAERIDYADFLRRAVALLESLSKSYYIKKDLAVFSKRGMA